MVVYFNRKDMVSFGSYLLSENLKSQDVNLSYVDKWMSSNSVMTHSGEKGTKSGAKILTPRAVISLIRNGQTTVSDSRPNSFYEAMDKEPIGDNKSKKETGKLYYSKGCIVLCVGKPNDVMFYGVKLIKPHPKQISKAYCDIEDESIIAYLKGEKPVEFKSEDFILFEGKVTVFHNGVDILKPILFN